MEYEDAKEVKKLRLFIDTTLLRVGYLSEMDNLPYCIEYFYPCVDPYYISKADNERVGNCLRTSKYGCVFNYNINSFKKIIYSEKFIGRFSKVMRPDQTQVLGQNFTEDGPVENTRKEHLKIDKGFSKKYKKILEKLKIINPAWKDFSKDMHTIATVLFVDEKYPFIKTLGKKGVWYFNLGKVPVANDDNLKYFITKDESGFFRPRILEKMEKEFSDLKIIEYGDLVETFR